MFPGAWVFPGGMVDSEDFASASRAPSEAQQFTLQTARIAGVRESREETGLDFEPDSLVHFSSWIPPDEVRKIRQTWFFLAQASEQEVVINNSEIGTFRWIRPSEALRESTSGNLRLEPPTRVTLSQLAKSPSVKAAMEKATKRNAEVYRSFRVVPDDPKAGLSWGIRT